MSWKINIYIDIHMAKSVKNKSIYYIYTLCMCVRMLVYVCESEIRTLLGIQKKLNIKNQGCTKKVEYKIYIKCICSFSVWNGFKLLGQNVVHAYENTVKCVQV